MAGSRTIHVSLSIHFTGVGFTSAAVALAQSMPAQFQPIIYVPQVTGTLPADVRHVRPLPSILPARIAHRRSVEAWARRRNEANLLGAVRREAPGALVWLWPGATLQLHRDLKAAGAIVIREMINTHAGTARRILDAEYARLGIRQTYRITEADQLAEQQQLALADLVISPSECVDASLLEWGVREDQIIRSTFGWRPEDFEGTSKADAGGQGVRVIFVGTVGVRKGIHLALAAWDRAKVNGTFIVVGPIDDESEPLVTPYRGREDIRFVPFTRDLASWYRAADFMFFPSLEEGAPLVCYQAGGAGLPILTGPMGQGRLIEHGVNGFVVDPHDDEALVAHLRLLAKDAELRRSFGTAIREKALRLNWKAVAQARADAFIGRGL